MIQDLFLGKLEICHIYFTSNFNLEHLKTRRIKRITVPFNLGWRDLQLLILSYISQSLKLIGSFGTIDNL